MSVLDTVKAESVALLDSFELAVHAAQEGYRAIYGHYCQLPLPMDEIPEAGTLQACDWSRFVSDVRFPWAASPVSLPASLPCGIEYHVSGKADGSRFYEAIVTVRHAGGLHRYSRTYGVAGVVSTDDWQEVIEDVV